MQQLQKQFANRAELIAYVKKLAPSADGVTSPILGGRIAAESALAKIDPINYASSRNDGDGKVTRLSPYIHHGVLSLNEVRHHALTLCSQSEQITKFIQELAWRDFWQRVLTNHPDWAWCDVEPYKTGFNSDDYSDTLPEDIRYGTTNVVCLNEFIHELINTGYLHNHARMYLASYVVHFRRVKWQAGAKWFLHHLLDGDVASNNLSWQWIASTFSNKPYIFNLENVSKYFGNLVDITPNHNDPINHSYESLNQQLFPNLVRTA